MSYLKRQGGVTLFELVLVLAISAGLITSAIAVRSSLRKDISFSASIEQVKNQIVAAKNESIQSVKAGDKGTGGSNSYDFGRAVEFFPAGDPEVPASMESEKYMRVSTLISELDDSPGDGLQQKMAKCDQRWEQYKDGVEYKGTERRGIVFQRKPEKTFVTPLNHNSTGGAVCEELALQSESDTPDYGGYDSDNDGFPDSVDDCDYEYAPAPDSTNGCPGGTPPPQSETCNTTGYVCGLYGRFYRIPYTFIGGEPVSTTLMRIVLTSASNGESFGADYGNTATWLPILRYKTQNPAARVSAYWSGQIRVPANTTRRFCLNTDGGSYMKINNVVVTNNPGSSDQLEPQSARCSDFTGGALDSWLDIDIYYNQNDAIESTPFVGLVYKDGTNNDVYVPGQDLRTVPGTVRLPSSVTSNGLRGEYFPNDSLSGNPFSVYTDNNTAKPPYSTNPSFSTGSNADSNVKQRTGQPWTSPFSASIRWTGQIRLTAPNQNFCVQMDNGARVRIGGVTVIDDWDNTQSSKESCATLGAAADWTNIVVEARKSGTNSYDGLGMTLDGNSVALRRSLDYSNGSDQILSQSSGDFYYFNFPNCPGIIDDSRTINYSRNGLAPSSRYKLDINYRYTSIPWGADTQVCIKVNGTWLNSDISYDFPYENEDFTSHRTFTLDNIVVPANGAIDLKIGIIEKGVCHWLGCIQELIVDRVDLWRGFDNTGNLIVKENNIRQDSSIMAKILSKISSSALAQGTSSCGPSQAECSILNYNNYKLDSTGDFTFYPDEAEFEFGIEGSSEKGTVKVDPQTNSITREIDL